MWIQQMDFHDSFCPRQSEVQTFCLIYSILLYACKTHYINPDIALRLPLLVQSSKSHSTDRLKQVDDSALESTSDPGSPSQYPHFRPMSEAVEMITPPSKPSRLGVLSNNTPSRQLFSGNMSPGNAPCYCHPNVSSSADFIKTPYTEQLCCMHDPQHAEEEILNITSQLLVCSKQSSFLYSAHKT